MAFMIQNMRSKLLGSKSSSFLSKLKASQSATARAFSTGSFKASDLVIEKTKNPKKRPAEDHQYEFGKLTTDHMLEIDWTLANGWGKPKISPYHAFQMDPANSTLHYALECFEGMKAYPNLEDKSVYLFRPIENMKRMQRSFEALAFPQFDAEEHFKLIKELVSIDKDWMPFKEKHSLYIRPTGISWENTLGVRPATAVKLYTILSPVGPYYPKGFKPVSVDCYTGYVRAWYKGSGDKKIGANYGPTIRPAQIVAGTGYDQILWLIDDYISEVGVMNVFIFWFNEEGDRELVTCPLDGTILPGVTRSSIIELCKDWDEFKVTEKRVKIQDLVKAVKEDRVIEMFGCGTATVVAPINNVGYNGQDYPIPIDEEIHSGKLAYRLWSELNLLQSGKKQFRDWIVKI